MGHSLGNICQNFAVDRLVAPTMRCAEEDESHRDVAEGSTSRLQAGLQQSLRSWSVVNSLHRMPWASASPALPRSLPENAQ
jgi:hypothetical protein